MTLLQTFVNQVAPLVYEIKDAVEDSQGYGYIVLDGNDNLVVCHSASQALSVSADSLIVSYCAEDFEEHSVEFIISEVVGYFGWNIMYTEAVHLVSSLIGGKLTNEKKEFVKVTPNFQELRFVISVDYNEETAPLEYVVFDQSVMEQDIVAVINSMMECIQDNLAIAAICECEL